MLQKFVSDALKNSPVIKQSFIEAQESIIQSLAMQYVFCLNLTKSLRKTHQGTSDRKHSAMMDVHEY